MQFAPNGPQRARANWTCPPAGGRSAPRLRAQRHNSLALPRRRNALSRTRRPLRPVPQTRRERPVHSSERSARCRLLWTSLRRHTSRNWFMLQKVLVVYLPRRRTTYSTGFAKTRAEFFHDNCFGACAKSVRMPISPVFPSIAPWQNWQKSSLEDPLILRADMEILSDLG